MIVAKDVVTNNEVSGEDVLTGADVVTEDFLISGDVASPTDIDSLAEGDMLDVVYVISGAVFVVDCDIDVLADVCIEEGDIVVDITVSPEGAAFGMDVAVLSYDELLTKTENIDVA